MRGVEIISSRVDDVPVKVVGRVDHFAIADNVDPLLAEKLRERGDTVDIVPDTQNSDKVVDMINKGGANAIVARTGIHLNDPDIFRRAPGLVAAFAACRDPEWNDPAMIENGVWGLRVDENTEQVADGTMAVIEALSKGQLQGAMATTVHPHGEWLKPEVGETMFDPTGKTIAIVGFGQVGRKLAMKALERSMNVVVHNDGPRDRSRPHDDSMKAEFRILQRMATRFNRTIKWADTMEDVLLSEPDILSIHTNSENYRGDTNNTGIVTREQLERLGANRGDKMKPIVINQARRQFVQASDAELAGLLNNGTLGFYVSDVFDPRKEKKGNFENPVVRPLDPRALDAFVQSMLDSGALNELPNAADILRAQVASHLESVRVQPSHWRRISSPHILGSGKAVGEASAKAVFEESIKQYWETGVFPLDRNYAFKRHFIRPTHSEGDLVITINRSIREGIGADIASALSELHFNVLSHEAVADRRSGTTAPIVPHSRVPHTLVMAMNGRTYDQSVRDIVDRLLQFGGKDINVIRPVPTSDEQKRILEGMDKYHTGFAAV